MSIQINKLVVIGLGLIGSSLAKAMKSQNHCRSVIGVARREETCRAAEKLNVVDRAVTQLTDLVSELGAGDVILIAVPTLSVENILQDIHAAGISPSVTITDGASVKGSVIDAVRRVFGHLPAQFVGGHPIAGSEQSGVEAANDKLYVDHRVILTPTAETGPEHLAKVKKLWELAGAEVLTMPVEEHDQVLAATSHLPHAIAFSLVDTLAHDSENENIFRYAAGGFRDFTRIASSDPVMWHDIMRANRASVLQSLDLFTDNLSRLRSAVETDDSTYLLGVFTRAKSARDHFTKMLARQAYNSESQKVMSKFHVLPGGSIQGSCRVPGDKSISHRSIMLGSIAEGVTDVEGFLEGEDALATLQAFRDMGVVIEGPDQGKVKVHGVGLNGLEQPPGQLYLGNSGTSMRLLSGLLAGQTFTSTLTGDESLSRRPMKRVADPLSLMGADIETGVNGVPPLVINGNAQLTGIDYSMPMASAQVKSCLLLAGLYAEGTTRVTEPAPTRDHTERMLSAFGVEVVREGNSVSLSPGQSLKATSIEVPADISSATFFMVAAAIAPGSDVTLQHVGINPTRDGVITILKLMGADITLSNERLVGGEPVADIRVRYTPLQGIEVPEDQVPLAIDEFPALFVAAACSQGRFVLSGAEELRVKESDRIQAMADGLALLGVKAEPKPDGIIIEGGEIGGGVVDSLGDHRIAMAFAVAGLRATAPITIDDCANVATSFPTFVGLAKELGLQIDVLSS